MADDSQGFNAARFVASQSAMLTKINGVLERLKEELGKEIKEEKDLFDKAMCWCKSESKLKDEAVCKLRDTVSGLKQRI